MRQGTRAFGRRDVLIGLGSTIVAARGAAVRVAADGRAAHVLDGISEGIFRDYPETATFLGVDTGSRAALRHQLTDRTPEGVDRLRAHCNERLRALRALDWSRLPWAQSLDIRATLSIHELAAEGYTFDFGDNLEFPVALPGNNSPYVISQGTGWFSAIPDFLDSQHKVETREDADAYLDRLRAFARGLDGETERLRRDAGHGVVAPDFILDTLLSQEHAYLATEVGNWGLITSLSRRAVKAGLGSGWADRARVLCTTEIAPALSRQAEAVRALRATASADAGTWKLPQGDAYYAWALKAATTTDRTPDEIHALGFERIRALDSEMDGLLRKSGMTSGTVGERLAALSKDPRQLYPDSDTGRADLIAYLNQKVAGIRLRLPRAFSTQNKADLVIKRVPPEIEAGAPYGYAVYGSLDGSRPSSYYINLADMSVWPRLTLPTLCFHEGIPGHIWEASFTHDLPMIRSQFFINAYSEGWALYAEQLADELGMYEDDPLGRLGYLQSIQFRACRLVLDTGLHAKRWTRDKAIAWLIATNGIPAASARGEVDRYCVWPGQACGYEVGHLELTRQRQHARDMLRSRFTLAGFHEAVLRDGPLPMSLVGAGVERYIRTTVA